MSQEMSQLQVQLQGNQDALNRAQQNKIAFESALNVAQSTEASLKRVIETAKELRNVKSSAASSPQNLQKKSEALEEQLTALRATLRPEHPDIRSLQRLIEQATAR